MYVYQSLSLSVVCMYVCMSQRKEQALEAFGYVALHSAGVARVNGTDAVLELKVRSLFVVVVVRIVVGVLLVWVWSLLLLCSPPSLPVCSQV
jgi:hypothetical protein